MAIKEERLLAEVTAEQPGPTPQELHDLERVPVPPLLRVSSWVNHGLDDIPKERYFSQEYHDLEVEHVWKKVWQMACREEDIPQVGDTLVYEIAGMSVLVVRCEPDEIKAFPNACLHRGAQLRVDDGNVPELRCPFHGFTWALDGSLKEIPSAWDFPQINRDCFDLPEYKVGTWDGFVFINLDPQALPLEDYLGDIPEHTAQIASPPMFSRYKGIHVAKVVRCNWKLGVEAFLESYHGVATHPQTALWTADSNSQYDVFPGEAQRHWNRMIVPTAVPSPAVTYEIDEQDIADSIASVLMSALGMDELEVPEGDTARKAVGDTLREYLGGGMGFDTSAMTDCQVIDTLGYYLFPNFVPFISLVQSLAFRFRPYGNDPEMSIMEVMVLFPFAEGEEMPQGEPPVWIGPDESFTTVDLGMFNTFAPILDQDITNMIRLQKGLRSSVKPGVSFARYQESRIRHMHSVLTEYVGK